MSAKVVVAKRAALVRVKQDCTLVLMGTDGKPHIEVRPHYEAGTGPTLLLYRVNGIEPTYMATITLPVLGALIQKLPIAISAAKRLARTTALPATNGGAEPNAKPDSSSP